MSNIGIHVKHNGTLVEVIKPRVEERITALQTAVGNALTAHPTITTYTDTTTTTNAGYGGSFEVVDYVERDSNGHVTTINTNTITLPTAINISGKADKATTLSGYGITDAKIVSGTITLGSNTITPLTSHQDISGKQNTLTSTNVTTSGSGNAVTSVTASNGTVTVTKGSTFLTSHPTITTSSDTTSTASPSNGGTFTTIDSITRDGNGHVTKVNTKTVTLPSGITSSDLTTIENNIKSDLATTVVTSHDTTHGAISANSSYTVPQYTLNQHRVEVYLNGVRAQEDVTWEENTTTSITFLDAIAADTEIDIKVLQNDEYMSPIEQVNVTGSGNAVTAMSLSGTTLTATKGSTFLTSHQDISGKANLSGATFTGNVITKGTFGTPVALSASAINLSLGTTFTKTISANTTFTISNAVSSKANCFTLILTNGGAYTVTWFSGIRWASGTAPDLTSSGVDVITFLTPDGGSTWYGVPSVLDAQASS